MYQLRIYAMRTADALQHYATVHWPRHIPSLRAFGVTTNLDSREPALAQSSEGGEGAETPRDQRCRRS